jgi:hypothetical protein
MQLRTVGMIVVFLLSSQRTAYKVLLMQSHAVVFLARLHEAGFLKMS